MGIEVTDEALAVLVRSLEMSGVDRRAGGIRLRAARSLGGAAEVQVELAGGPLEGDATLEIGGIRIFVDPELGAAMPAAVVALEPLHETVVVRPAADREPS